MRLTFPHGSHITRKRGIFHYRRRLPLPATGEVVISLRTRHFREAEYLAEQLAACWNASVVDPMPTREKIADVLKAELNRRLAESYRKIVETPYGRSVFDGDFKGPPREARAADLERCEWVVHRFRTDLAHRDLRGPESVIRELMVQHGVPAEQFHAFGLAWLQMYLEVAEKEQEWITKGPVAGPFLHPPAPAETAREATLEATRSAPEGTPRAPLASTLVEPFFVERERRDRTTHQVMNQERGTLRRFLEACGDRPLTGYGRGDVTAFLDTLRRLPSTYGRSPRDKTRTLAEIIAEADARGSPRLTEKTVKRHQTALSQFFRFGVDKGHLSVAGRTELTKEHRFRSETAAREQRDAWTAEELRALFASPVWTGCHPYFRGRPGATIIRDGRFWIPLLALFHGGRLEEFADLYRRDVGDEDGVWFFRITEEGGRRLKTRNAERVMPMHPEMVRLGFLSYVDKVAPNLDDPLFPELEPQGRDRKRGGRITRFFTHYRKTIGVYREGVATHSFRHNANTRLRDRVDSYQQERHINYLIGHGQGGGEGRERYDKGPGLKALAATLAMLEYPELDLSHLYEGREA